jgi:hypothetical protein
VDVLRGRLEESRARAEAGAAGAHEELLRLRHALEDAHAEGAARDARDAELSAALAAAVAAEAALAAAQVWMSGRTQDGCGRVCMCVCLCVL